MNNTERVLKQLDSRMRKHITPVGKFGRQTLSDVRNQMEQMIEMSKVMEKE
jgi:hypothetical protein